MLVLVVLTIVLASCASPVDEVEESVVTNPFEGVWQSASSGYITIWRINTITDSSGNITGTFTYDETYLYRYGTGNVSHIYVTYKYEFKDNGNELHLTWIPNVYGVVVNNAILQRILN